MMDNTMTNTMHMTGWIAVQRGVLVNYDLENFPLQIRTDSLVGSDEKVVLYLYTAEEVIRNAGGVELRFTTPPRYYLRYCTSESAELPTDLPTETDKIWTIILTRTSDVRLTIYCNDKEVLNVVMSAATCSDSDWSEMWSRDVGKIEFTSSHDTASDYYRPGKYLMFLLMLTLILTYDTASDYYRTGEFTFVFT